VAEEVGREADRKPHSAGRKSKGGN
jgi:hypothetical protein